MYSPFFSPHARCGHERVGDGRTAQIQAAARRRLENAEDVEEVEVQVKRGRNRLRRNDDGDDDRREPELLERELETRKAVAHERAGGNLQHRHREGDNQRVQERRAVIQQDFAGGEGVVRRRQVTRNRDDRGVVQVALRHERDAQLVQQGLDNHEAKPEQQQEANQLIALAPHRLAEQISAGLAVARPEAAAGMSMGHGLLTHRCSPLLSASGHLRR